MTQDIPTTASPSPATLSADDISSAVTLLTSGQCMVRNLALVILPNHHPKCQTSGDILRKNKGHSHQKCKTWIILVRHHTLVVGSPKFWDIVSRPFIRPARMMDLPKRKTIPFHPFFRDSCVSFWDAVETTLNDQSSWFLRF